MIAAMFLNMMYNLVDSLWIEICSEKRLMPLDKLHSHYSNLDFRCDGSD